MDKNLLVTEKADPRNYAVIIDQRSTDEQILSRKCKLK